MITGFCLFCLKRSSTNSGSRIVLQVFFIVALISGGMDCSNSLVTVLLSFNHI